MMMMMVVIMTIKEKMTAIHTCCCEWNPWSKTSIVAMIKMFPDGFPGTLQLGGKFCSPDSCMCVYKCSRLFGFWSQAGSNKCWWRISLILQGAIFLYFAKLAWHIGVGPGKNLKVSCWIHGGCQCVNKITSSSGMVQNFLKTKFFIWRC